jgi:predicted lactoylglutathione lyase
MTKQLWLNLPVKDVARSREFFTRMGFKFNDSQGVTSDSACMLVGEKPVVIMLFEEHILQGFTRQELTDTSKSTEMLISIDAESREEVDEMAVRAQSAGGIVFTQPEEIQGWMYGCGFCDPDGHRWNVLYMDVAKMNTGVS